MNAKSFLSVTILFVICSTCRTVWGQNLEGKYVLFDGKGRAEIGQIYFLANGTFRYQGISFVEDLGGIRVGNGKFSQKKGRLTLQFTPFRQPTDSVRVETRPLSNIFSDVSLYQFLLRSFDWLSGSYIPLPRAHIRLFDQRGTETLYVTTDSMGRAQAELLSYSLPARIAVDVKGYAPIHIQTNHAQNVEYRVIFPSILPNKIVSEGSISFKIRILGDSILMLESDKGRDRKTFMLHVHEQE